MHHYLSVAAVMAVLVASGCDTMSSAGDGKSESAAATTQNAPRGEVAVAAEVTITQDAAGDYAFAYKAPFANSGGDFDFSTGDALYKTVRLTFTIADGSVDGLKFVSATDGSGADAIYIVEKARLSDPNGSPTERYQGTQFSDFRLSGDGRTLSLSNINDDGLRYRYNLRFDHDGKTVEHDPDQQNGPPRP